VASSTNPILRLLKSTIGLKIIMALTGLALAGFLVGHMTGHLQVLSGDPGPYNKYAHFLQSLGLALWAVRLGLLGLFVVHIYSALELKKRNDAARPHPYAHLENQRTTIYGKMMLVSGIILAVYLVYHLMHFTLGWVHPQYFNAVDSQGRHDVYKNFVESFRNPLITIIYVAASVFVAAHLAHALSSMFRTLGLSVGRFRTFFDKAGPVVGIITGVGFVVPPLAILVRLVG
jgi:succinate dehydrogenase / fumarate reductase cytochrome b subunit